MWWRKLRETRDASCDVVAGAAAVIGGRIVDARPVPPKDPWCWVNTLSHGSCPALQELAARRVNAPANGWEAAAVFLASELGAACGSPGGLLDLQRAVLIPLELDLLDGRTTAPQTPGELVSIVRRELARARRNQPATAGDGPEAPHPGRRET